MSVAVENTKILAVDTSTAMLHVLKNFSDKHGYESDCFSDPAEACSALSHRFDKFDSDYRCVLLGWPEGSLELISDLLGVLASTDHQDLPLLIVCQEMTTDIQTIVKRRARTKALLWKDYQSAAKTIDRLALTRKSDKPQAAQSSGVAAAANATVTNAAAIPTVIATSGIEIKALLLDSAPSVSRGLRGLMESNGYQVTVASSIAQGKEALEAQEYDLVVTDFFLRGEGGEEICRYLQSTDNLPGHKPVCVVISSKYSDAIVKRSLAVGAISCLSKDESTELLFARIDALIKAVPGLATDTPLSDNALSEMLELVIGPALFIGGDGVIAGINQKANRLLDDINRRQLIGCEFSSFVCRTPVVLEKPQNSGFLTSSGSEIAVSYMAQNVSVKGNYSGVLLTFKPQPVKLIKDKVGESRIALEPLAKIDSHNPPTHNNTPAVAANITNSVVAGSDAEVSSGAFTPLTTEISLRESAAEIQKEEPEAEEKPVKKVAIPTTIEGFTETLSQVVSDGSSGARHCVLLLDIQLIAATGDRLSLGHSEPMLKIVKASLAGLYPRDNSFTYLGEGQFGFVLATRRLQDALVLTRKLLQVVPQLVKYLSNMTLVSHGAVLQLSEDTLTDDATAVLNKCRRGCSRARKDKRDNTALIMPMNKYLSAESTPQKITAKEKAAVE